MTAPVQVLVVGFEQPTFSGDVLAELARLRESGIVRLIDVLLVSRAEDGSFDTVEPPEGFADDAGTGAVVSAILGGAAGEPQTGAPGASWSLADAVPAGSAAAIALIEHTWAAGLAAAIRGAGGTALEETWLAPADLERLAALRDQVAGFTPRT